MPVTEMEKKGPNPFLNHLVIENILKYVNNTHDLRALRQLCHQWEGIVTPKLLQNSIVYINSERKMQRYQDSSPVVPIHKNFHLKVLQSLESVEAEMFLRLILESANAEELHLSKCVMKENEILRILKRGKTLKTLSFNEVLVDKGGNDLSLCGKIEMNFTSHTLLRLEVTTCDEGEEFPWTQILSVTPNLQVLHAQLQSSEQVTTLLESMLDLEQRPSLHELSSFLVDFNTPQLNLLQCLEFPLNFLDISIDSSVSTLCIQDLLKSEGLKNIENLKLFHETENELNEIKLPKLNNLKSLEIMGDPVICSKIFSEINKSCPKLRNLNLSQIMRPEEIHQLKFEHQNLNSLSIEEGYLHSRVLSKLGKLFPNMKKVCLFLRDDNVSALFKEFANLEELIVLGCELTDLGIIGVTPMGRSRIGDCKKLRKFSLYPQPQNRITDMTIYHGLLHVEQLTYVELPETAITNEGLKTLLKAKPNLARLSAKIAINPRTGEHSFRSSKYQVL